MNDVAARFETFERTKYFPALDGLRTCCIFMVFFAHMHEPHPRYGFYGWLGVDVFFVLSGFLITTLLVREQQKRGTVSLKAFYIRRFFRIVPVYLFTVALYGAAVLVGHDALKRAQFFAVLPYLLAFLQEYTPVAAGNVFGHAWTLGVEEKFYAFWPLLLLWLYPFRRKAMIGLVIFTLLILPLPRFYGRAYGGLLFGALLGLLCSMPHLQRFAAFLPKIPNALLWLLLAVTYATAGWSDHFILAFSFAAALLIGSLVLRESLSRRVLSHPFLVYAGKRSYAMYLIHVLVVDSVEKLVAHLMVPTWPVVICIAFPATLAGAAVMERLIERPSIAMGRRISKRILGEQAGPAIPSAVSG